MPKNEDVLQLVSVSIIFLLFFSSFLLLTLMLYEQLARAIKSYTAHLCTHAKISIENVVVQ